MIVSRLRSVGVDDMLVRSTFTPLKFCSLTANFNVNNHYLFQYGMKTAKIVKEPNYNGVRRIDHVKNSRNP